MLHQKNAADSIRKVLNFATNAASETDNPTHGRTARLALVPTASELPERHPAGSFSARLELLHLSAKKCSSFLAEAAVLVLVFAVLDRLVLKDRMEFAWAASAFGISLALLAGSIAIDYATSRWLTPS